MHHKHGSPGYKVLGQRIHRLGTLKKCGDGCWGESKNPLLGVRRSFPLARKSRWMTVLWCQGTETLIGTRGEDHCVS